MTTRFIKRDPDKGYIDTWLYVPKSYVNVTATQSALTFVLRDKRTERDRVLALYREAPHHLLLPRAFWDPATLTFPVVDCRPRSYEHIDFKSRIQLDYRMKELSGKKVLVPTGDDVQRRSIAALQRSMGGTLQLACGKGKTVIALQKIAEDKVPAIILLDNHSLLSQWRDDIEEFLEVPGGVGMVGDGKFDWEGRGIVLATYHTIATRADDLPSGFTRRFGNVFWDEGHHANAPMFSRSCTVFYGNRYSLTATPEREDGLHIIAQFHIGQVLYKDLKQMMKARFVFKWTGLALDLTNVDVNRAVVDVTGEVHNSKVTSFLAGHLPHLQILFQDAIDAVAAGRKVLVLTDSVAEAANLTALWTRGWGTPLYSDIPIPTAAELKLTTEPVLLSEAEADKLKVKITSYWKTVSKARRPLGQALETEVNKAMVQWAQHRAGMKVRAELGRRQREFIRALVEEESSAGIMTYEVPPEEHQRFLRERQIIFAITKYGKEALDCPPLDTILVSSLFSARPGLQQLMGRPTRPAPGKKTPTVVFYVHTIGQHIGMSKKLQKHLRSWPLDESGPFDYELLNYPEVTSCKIRSLKEAFGS
jgi:superfamily II DNA or RNA helicase